MGKMLRFTMRTWYYDKRRPIAAGGFAQTFVNAGEEVAAEHVVFGETGTHDAYVALGYAEYADEQGKQGKQSTAPDAGKGA